MSETERRYLVVWNPAAGRKGGIPTNGVDEETIRGTMAAHGLGTELFLADSVAATAVRVRSAIAEGCEVVVAAGGDGTAGQIAKQLIGTETALAVLPLGSAMNIARSLRIPRDLDEAARIVATAPIRRVDVGVAVRGDFRAEAPGRHADGPQGDASIASGGHVFFEIASIGLDAALFAEAQRIDRGHYGSIVGLARVIRRSRPTRVRIGLDDRTVEMHALMIAVANGPYTGLGLTLAPQARLDDGLFDVAVFHGFSRWEIIRHLGAIVAGRRRYSPKVRTFRARRVTVDGRRRLPVRADADDLGRTPATFEVRPAVLRVVAPATLSEEVAAGQQGGTNDEDRGAT